MNDPLFDSGVIFAALDRSDAWHHKAVQLIAECSQPPHLPVTTLAEVCYFARKALGGRVELAFIQDIADGAFTVVDLTDADVERAAEVMSDYPEVGFVDASVVALAERLRCEAVATVDRRHFASVRPRHVRAFRLLP